ncbi:anti-sigma factor domain-containing protein [Thermostichus sp. MS-CIW-30]
MAMSDRVSGTESYRVSGTESFRVGGTESLSTSPPLTEEREELAGYLLGDLSPEQASALEARLTQDPRLVAELQALQETLELLPYGLPGVLPPASLRDQVMAEVGAIGLREQEMAVPLHSPLPAFGVGWRWLGGLVAAILVLLSLDNWRLRQALQLAQLEPVRALSHLLQQPGSRLVHLQGEVGTANVLFRPGDWQEVILAARDLPQPVAGERYSLWLKLDNGEFLHCGDFQVDAQGSALVALRPSRTLPAGTRAQELLVATGSRQLPARASGTESLKPLLTGKV